MSEELLGYYVLYGRESRSGMAGCTSREVVGGVGGVETGRGDSVEGDDMSSRSESGWNTTRGSSDAVSLMASVKGDYVE